MYLSQGTWGYFWHAIEYPALENFIGYEFWADWNSYQLASKLINECPDMEGLSGNFIKDAFVKIENSSYRDVIGSSIEEDKSELLKALKEFAHKCYKEPEDDEHNFGCSREVLINIEATLKEWSEIDLKKQVP